MTDIADGKVLITGIGGFIGYHVAGRLLKTGVPVIGLDNLNDYYDVKLKQDRLHDLGFGNNQTHSVQKDSFFYKTDLKDKDAVLNLFQEHKIKTVIHLAAQAGVRYSLKHPHAYIESNIMGFLNMLEACRQHPVNHLIYASSSSVYGLNQVVPFSEKHHTDHPASLYAATKKSNEMMAHAYSHLYQIPVTGLRFFTVYGPWGRPDMAAFIFTEKILNSQPIDVYNYGKMKRDFTYVDDVVEGIIRLIDRPPSASNDWNGIDNNPQQSIAPYRIFNIGNHTPVPLEEFISILEDITGKKATINYLPIQPGDVVETYADVDSLSKITGFAPSTSIREGLKRFVEWYKEYYFK